MRSDQTTNGLRGRSGSGRQSTSRLRIATQLLNPTRTCRQEALHCILDRGICDCRLGMYDPQNQMLRTTVATAYVNTCRSKHNGLCCGSCSLVRFMNQ